MTDKAKTKPMEQAQENMKSMTDRALKNYDEALRTGLKLQEEAARCWSSMLGQANAAAEMQKRWSEITQMASGLMPLAQRRMEEIMGLMENNSRTGAELMKKIVDASQTLGQPECQSKWMDLWISSMGALRSNMEAAGEINSRILNSWVSFVQEHSKNGQTLRAA
jgi:hypothetical protein